MPISKVGFIRTDGQGNAPKGKDPFVPFYSVLFYFGKDEDFVNTSSGSIGIDYYRKFNEVMYPSAVYYRTDGSFSTLQSNPLINCVDQDNLWKNQTGVCFEPTTSLPNTAATLFQDYTHNPKTLGRTVIYNSLGYASGDTSSTTETYISQTGDNTHKHSANNIAAGLRSISYGELSKDGTYTQGINAIAVKPILRDPQLTTTSTGYNDTKLAFFPKNVLVFGSSLPTNNYTNGEVFVHTNSANGKILPLIAKDTNIGVLGISNTLTFTITSNTVLNHNHNSFPATPKAKSNKTNQQAYKINEAGAHSHQVTYTCNVAFRSKMLRAWVTSKDVTPIANGVIIAYAIGPNTLYAGLDANSKVLPVNWHFCDGTNDTPDLRGYYVYANFANSSHDVVISSSNTLTINAISMAANGNHSHLGPLTGIEVGTGTAVDTGSHTFEDTLNHTHTISPATSFNYGTGTANVTNILAGQSYNYTPPTVKLAFIMYNNTIT